MSEITESVGLTGLESNQTGQTGITIYIINLPKSLDRLKKSKNILNKQKITNYCIFKAINGDNLDIYQLIKQDKYSPEKTHKIHGRQLSKREIGCALSHLQVLQKIVDENIQRALIFEDDFDFDPKWDNDILDKIPENAEYCTFFYKDKLLDGLEGKKDIDKGFYEIPKGAKSSCVCYWVSLSGAQKILEEAYPIRYASDGLIGKKIREGQLKAYFCYPRLVLCRKRTKSTIGNRKYKPAINYNPTAKNTIKKNTDADKIDSVKNQITHISPRKTYLNNKNRELIIPNSKRHQKNLANVNKMPNVVMSCYFCSKKDPQRSETWKPDKYEIIKPWYESMVKHGLHGIIFHDKLSDNFVKKYQTDKIKFQKCVLGHYSTNDERFILYYMYLLKYYYKNILMTDISDVIINKNPFPLITQKEHQNKIFIGRDQGNCPAHSVYCNKIVQKIRKHRPNTPYFEYTTEMMQSFPLYNPGLIGGSYEIILKFLSRMVKGFFRLDVKTNTNLMMANYVLHQKYMEGFNDGLFNREPKQSYSEIPGTACTKLIFSGFPFNSPFKKYEKEGESDAYLLHK